MEEGIEALSVLSVLILASHAELARRLEALEKKYDVQFKGEGNWGQA